jgi:hypothetical protein
MRSYVGRILRPTLLAPVIVEAILNGRQPPEMTFGALMRPFAVAWTEQRRLNRSLNGKLEGRACHHTRNSARISSAPSVNGVVSGFNFFAIANASSLVAALLRLSR